MPATTWLTPQEKEELVALAKQVRLTTSSVIRRLVTGRQLPVPHRHEAVLDLVKINADLARLGNLLRMALADKDFQTPATPNLHILFNKIRTTQALLKTKIESRGQKNQQQVASD